MATMWDENFSFDSPRSPSTDSSNASSTRDTSRSVSPCSPTSTFPAPRFSVTDLAAQFGQQRIRKDSQICYDHCDAYAAQDDDAGWSVQPSIEEEDGGMPPVSRSRTAPARPVRPHSPSQRLQRQVNARMLCSNTHHRDIAALVSRMVQSKEQCSVSVAAISADDEGYDSSNGSTPAHSRRSSVATINKCNRRSSDMKSTGACVSKVVRYRRDTGRGHSRIQSSDS